MATYDTLLAEVKTILQGISNVGVVHDYQRLAKDQVEMLSKFKTTIGSVDQIRGWNITRINTPSEYSHMNKGIMREYHFILRGYMSIDDDNASEKTFQSLADTVLDTFDTNGNLNGAALELEPAQLEAFTPSVFGGKILCHFCRIHLVAKVKKTF